MLLKIAILYGSVRENRQGIKFAKFLENECKKRGCDVTLIDPMEYELGLMDKMLKSYKDEESPEVLVKLSKILKDVDGYIIVSGEYNHSIPPALSNLMDYFQTEYFFKPAAITTYSAGIFGGVRAAMQLRAFLSELGMATISSTLPVGKVQSVFDNDGSLLDESYVKKTQRFLDEFEWYVEALKKARLNGTPY